MKPRIGDEIVVLCGKVRPEGRVVEICKGGVSVAWSDGRQTYVPDYSLDEHRFEIRRQEILY